MRKFIWISAIVLIVAAATASVFKFRKPGGNTKIDEKLVVKVKKGKLKVEVRENGTIQPKFKVEVKSKVAGQVTKVLVEEGARVKEGQLLMTIEETSYSREVARCQAQIENARAQLNYAKAVLVRKREAAKVSV